MEFIAHEMPNLIVNLTDAESYTAFNSDDKSSPKAILFTEKKNTTLLYKALSVYFKGTLLLAEVREYPRLATAFGITKYPTLVVTKGKHRYSLSGAPGARCCFTCACLAHSERQSHARFGSTG